MPAPRIKPSVALPSLLVLMLAATPAVTQEPTAPEPTSPTEILTKPACECRTPWHADLLVGLPLAVRVQRQFGEHPLWFEAGGGVYLILPTAFVGVRAEGRILETRRHVVAVRPGLDAWYFQGGADGGGWLGGDTQTMGGVTLDFDLHWRCRWSDHYHSLLGLKLGGGFAFGNAKYGPIPVVALTFGGNF